MHVIQLITKEILAEGEIEYVSPWAKLAKIITSENSTTYVADRPFVVVIFLKNPNPIWVDRKYYLSIEFAGPLCRSSFFEEARKTDPNVP